MKWKKLVQPKPRETTSRTVCDFCGENDRSGRGWDGSEVIIEAKIGSVYPECDARKMQEFDCCPTCWESKVVPALTAIGGQVYEHPADEAREMPMDTKEHL